MQDELRITASLAPPVPVLALGIRSTVFTVEQGIPGEMDLDEHDDHAWHYLLFSGGKAIGTARLYAEGEGWHFGRMAVLASHRDVGAGGMLLEYIIAHAREMGGTEIVLSAQERAVPFYERHGFAREGDWYDEVGIPHLWMRLGL